MKRPPASPLEEQSPSTIKGPQSPLFNCRGQLADNHVKKCRKESSSGEEESRQITCRRPEPAERSADLVAFCYRGDYRTSHPALSGQPPSQQSSRRLQALSLQPSCGVVPKKKRQNRQYLPGITPHKPEKLYNTHRWRAGGLESSLHPCVCFGEANPGRVVFPQKKVYFSHSRCSAISHPSFKTFLVPPSCALPRVPKAKQKSSQKTLPFPLSIRYEMISNFSILLAHTPQLWLLVLK